MTEKKTLKLPDAAQQAEAPAAQEAGARLGNLRIEGSMHCMTRRAKCAAIRALRTRALAARFAEADQSGATSSPADEVLVGSAIVDFNCHTLGMAIAIDEEGANEAIAKRRDIRASKRSASG